MLRVCCTATNSSFSLKKKKKRIGKVRDLPNVFVILDLLLEN